MDSTTKKLAEKIIINGYYFPYETLGKGGWEYVYEKTPKPFKSYIFISSYSEEEVKFKAISDIAAINALYSKFTKECVEEGTLLKIEYKEIKIK